jgi:hypothetical protein
MLVLDAFKGQCGDIASLLQVLDVVNEMFKDNSKQLPGKEQTI